MPYPYYGSYMPNYYQPMQNMGNQFQPMPMNQQTAPQVPQVAPTTQTASPGIIWVQGEEGAKGYLVAPGESRLLMDSEGNHFYLKSTDAQGMPLPLRIFDYVERTSQKQASQAAQASGVEYAPLSRLEALEARIDALAAPKTTSKKSSVKEDCENG